MTKNFLNQNDVGAACVFTEFDGGSASATIMEVGPDHVTLRTVVPRPNGSNRVLLTRHEFKRITLFPKDSKFLVLETL
jgi:hypothetical protein